MSEFNSFRRKLVVILVLAASILYSGCQPVTTESSSGAAALAAEDNSIMGELDVPSTAFSTPQPSKTAALPLTSTPTNTPPAPTEPVPAPSATPQPTSTPTSTPTVTPSFTPIGPCDERIPGEELLVLVDRDYGLSREFEPADLVEISSIFPPTITKGYPTEVREVIIEPLTAMVEAMLAEGLQPKIVSGYRDYAAQSIAWAKWMEQEPDRVGIISAPPGHSEHQLGTTVDFGSPELGAIVGDESVEFHTYFYKTKVGQWLEENAHSYGFTLSYPLEAFEITGFYYEPWHYRYVGIELAKELKRQEISLIEYLRSSMPEQCIPKRP